MPARGHDWDAQLTEALGVAHEVGPSRRRTRRKPEQPRPAPPARSWRPAWPRRQAHAPEHREDRRRAGATRARQGRCRRPAGHSTSAATVQRRDRRSEVVPVGARYEVVCDPDDPQRFGDRFALRVPREPHSIPALRPLAERPAHLVGQMEVPGEHPAALAQVRRHPLELSLAPNQQLGDQTSALGKRPVVGQVAGEVRQALGRLGGRSEDLHATLEVDLIAAHPARDVGRRRCAADVDDERDVVDLRARLGGVPSRSASSSAARQTPSSCSNGWPRPRSVASECAAIGSATRMRSSAVAASTARV